MSWRETLRPRKAVRPSTAEPITLMPVPMRPPTLRVAAASPMVLKSNTFLRINTTVPFIFCPLLRIPVTPENIFASSTFCKALLTLASSLTWAKVMERERCQEEEDDVVRKPSMLGRVFILVNQAQHRINQLLGVKHTTCTKGRKASSRHMRKDKCPLI